MTGSRATCLARLPPNLTPREEPAASQNLRHCDRTYAEAEKASASPIRWTPDTHWGANWVF